MARPPPPLSRIPASPLPSGIRRFLRAALAEDKAGSDVTTRLLLERPRLARGRIVVQAPGVLSGVAVAAELGRLQGVRPRVLARDGERVRRGRTVLEYLGDARTILSIERTALNLLMHLSGVATATAMAVKAAAGRRGKLAVFATRKTLPGLRDLEKRAVVHGGGYPHRRDLSDAVLIKRTHLALVPLTRAVGQARAGAGRHRLVQVEVRSGTEAVRAVRAGADALLVDNASPSRAARVVEQLVEEGLRHGVWVELSGGITLGNIGRYARTGADAASLGALTHSAPALPFHLVMSPLTPASRSA